MNIHEYQGKEILASYGVRIQRGIVIMQLKLLLLKLTTETGTSWFCNSQVHGGRGKGGGVKLAKTYNK
jgi:succinyl-CoA synthetase beta subunit